MPEILWTLDTLVDLCSHPSPRVRNWAALRLAGLPAREVASRVVPFLDDLDEDFVVTLVGILDESGDPSFAPPLLERLPTADGALWVAIARTLARLGCRDAMPLLAGYLDEGDLPDSELRACLQAMAILDGPAVRPVFRDLILDEHEGHMKMAIVAAWLHTRPTRDLGWLVDHAMGCAPRWRDEILDHLCMALDIYSFDRALSSNRPSGLDTALDLAREWLGGPLPLDATEEAALREGSRIGYAHWSPILHQAALRILAERGHPVEEWLDSRQLPDGYRWHAAATVALLEALGRWEGRSNAQTRLKMAGLALAAFAALLMDDDYTTLLESSEDRPALLARLVASRSWRLPLEILDEAASLGLGSLDWLLPLLEDHKANPVGATHAADVLDRLARVDPESCAPAIPLLADLLDSEDGLLAQVGADALVRFGPLAVNAFLSKVDSKQEFELPVESLGRIPCAEAAQAIQGLVDAQGEVDPLSLEALERIGWRESIPWLADQDAGEPDVADVLLTLCAIHGMDHPNIPEWEATLEEACDLDPSSFDRGGSHYGMQGGPSVPKKGKKAKKDKKKVRKAAKKQKRKNRR